MKTVFPILLSTAAILGTNNGVHGNCGLPANALTEWYYVGKTELQGSYNCVVAADGSRYAMLNAYRSGRTQNVHWKYTNNLNDPACLNNWKYYSSDGQQLIAAISGRTTTQNDPKRWCALPVYRQGGVKGKQWQHCDC